MKFGNRAVSVALFAAISFSGIFASANSAKNKRKNNNGLRKDSTIGEHLKKPAAANRKLSKGGSKVGEDEAPMRNGALDEGEEPIVLGENKTPDKAGAIVEDYYPSSSYYPPPAPTPLPGPPCEENPPDTPKSDCLNITDGYMCMARYAYEEDNTDLHRPCDNALQCTNDMTKLKFKYTAEGCPEPANDPDDPSPTTVGIDYRCMVVDDRTITGGVVWIIEGDHFDKLNNTAVQPKTMDHLSWFMKHPSIKTIYKSEIWIDEEYSFEIKNDGVDYTEDDVTYMAFDKYGELVLFAAWNLACGAKLVNGDPGGDGSENNYSIGNFFANSMFTGFQSDFYGVVSSHIYPQFKYNVKNDCGSKGTVASLVRTYFYKECDAANFICKSVEHNYNPFECVKKNEELWKLEIQAGCTTDPNNGLKIENGMSREFKDLFAGKGAVDLLTTEIKVEVDVMVKYYSTWMMASTWNEEVITKCPMMP